MPTETKNGNGQQYTRFGPLLNREEFESRLQAQILNATSMRVEFLRRYLTMDPRRNLENDCGYPEGSVIDPWFFRDLYDREPVATRVVELMPKEAWQVQPVVYEDEDSDSDTPFEAAVDGLSKQLRGDSSWYQDDEGSPVNEYLYRANKLSRIGSFGILLFGFDDGLPLHMPVDGMTSDKPTRTTQNMLAQSVLSNSERELAERHFAETGNKLIVNAPNPSGSGTFMSGGSQEAQPVGMLDSQFLGVRYSPPEYPSSTPRKAGLRILFLRPFDQTLVQVTQWEANIRSPRFGQPIMYRVTLNDPREASTGIGMPMATVQVHWTRILHLADNLNSSEVIGVPAIRPVLNPVLDIRKIRGASGEAYWKGGFPGLSLETHPQLGGDVPIDDSSLKDMIENYMNSLQRYMVNVGMSAKMLAPSCVDPTPYVNVALEAICVQLGCPVRVFRGSERGELASSQDDSAWNDRVRHYQVSYCTPRIIVPFYDRLIMAGILPAPARKGPTNNYQRRLRVYVRGQNVYNADTGELVDGPGTDKNDRSKTVDAKGGYSVRWPDLDSLGDKDKAAIALQETQAVAAYVSGGCENFLQPKDFWTTIMSRDKDEAEALVQGATDHQEETLASHGDMADAAEEHDLTPTPPPGFEKKAEPPPPFPGAPGGPPRDPVKLGAGQALVHPDTGKTVAAVPAPKPPTKNEEEFIEFPTGQILNRKRLLKTLEDEEMAEPDRTDTIPTDNSFCATGEGGGVDPSCSPGGHEVGRDHVADLRTFKTALAHESVSMEDAEAVARHVLSTLPPAEAKRVVSEVSGEYGVTSKKTATEKLIRDLLSAKEFHDRADVRPEGQTGPREVSDRVKAALPIAKVMVERAKG